MPTIWRNRIIMAAPFIGVALLAIVTPADDGPTVCPFALCTGMACPGCGMTRAAASLVKGDVGAALTYHPLVPLIGLQLLGAWTWFMLRRRGTVQPMSNRTLNVILIATGIALVTVWIARMASGSLPTV